MNKSHSAVRRTSARQDSFRDQAYSSSPAGNPAWHKQSPRKKTSGRSNRTKRKSRLPWVLLLVILAVVGYRSGWFGQLFQPERINPPPPITGLHPVVAAKQKELVSLTGQQGIRVVITDGFRSSEEQDALYNQGRSEAGAVVTYAKGGQSYHNYGLAIDFALKKPDGNIIWDLDYDGNQNGRSDWLEVVGIAKKLGFTWGGDWTDFPDYPHLQMDFGYSIKQLKRGLRPKGYATPQP